MRPPRISVIIPVYNDRVNLRKCLLSLTASSWQDYECIVVDDASTDGSAGIARDLDATVLELTENRGPAYARNAGSKRARGELLFFTDADCEVHPDTLQKVHQTFQENQVLDAVIGCYDDTPGHPAFVSQYKNLFHHFIHSRAREATHTFWAACGAIKREVFLGAGGFDEFQFRQPSIEDIELGLRLFVQSKQVRLRKDLLVRHNKRWRLLNLIKTDIFDRGIPWTRLMLENKVFPNDLNVQISQKLSVFAVYTSMLLSFAVPLIYRGVSLILIWVTGIIAIILLNYPFYRFFIKKRGLSFAIRTVPLHLLYFLYCGIGFLGGLGLHLFRRPSLRESASGSRDRIVKTGPGSLVSSSIRKPK